MSIITVPHYTVPLANWSFICHCPWNRRCYCLLMLIWVCHIAPIPFCFISQPSGISVCLKGEDRTISCSISYAQMCGNGFQWHHTIRSVSYSQEHRADTNAPIDPLLQGNFGDAGWKTLEIIGGFKSYSNYNSNCVVLSGCAACLAVREVLREIRTSLCWNATNCSNISMQPYKTWETKLTFTHSELALTKSYNFHEHMNKWNPWTNATEFLVHWKTEKSCRNSRVSS